MRLHVYSVYDAVVGAYGTPFSTMNEGYAKRAMIDGYQNRGEHNDFVLYYLGEYDTDSALFALATNPVRVCSLFDLIGV